MTNTPTAELAAAQACLRLLHTARAALSGPSPAAAATLLAGPIAEADEALRRAGLTGNEAELLNRIYDLEPDRPDLRPGPAPASSPSSIPSVP
ncbi:hypothetical protein GCM10010277_31000 [Streptomyces longisporoflavus]|uniref:hypothetical protein n=1 Tax=Streptomyces longisporoflavus TaxID=28044 RepID=UPI00167D5C8E|nr:hypothetical protein [Streptomyces longisporoflavus]GGV41927.1 hypothetical protein GCM10010277_31000 [Streptomyces longisporoflavus]